MIDERAPLLLGSASPRRREILGSLGIPFVVRPAQVDERARPGEPPETYLARIVDAKLAAALAAMEGAPARPAPAAVLVADTIVLLEGAILGKPADRADAERMLCFLSGRTHEVQTRFAVARAPSASAAADAGPPPPGAPAASPDVRNGYRVCARTVTTRVTFRELLDEEIAAYAASGEGLDKAGAYAVQGLGSFAVERIDGSYTNVVGLPACELVVALRELGLLGRFPR